MVVFSSRTDGSSGSAGVIMWPVPMPTAHIIVGAGCGTARMAVASGIKCTGFVSGPGYRRVYERGSLKFIPLVEKPGLCCRSVGRVRAVAVGWDWHWLDCCCCCCCCVHVGDVSPVICVVAATGQYDVMCRVAAAGVVKVVV